MAKEFESSFESKIAQSICIPLHKQFHNFVPMVYGSLCSFRRSILDID